MAHPPAVRIADRLLLAAVEAALIEARQAGDEKPPIQIVATCLEQLGAVLTPARGRPIELRAARDDWLRRLASASRSASTVAAYRFALDDLIEWLERSDREASTIQEETIVAYLDNYRRRRNPAPATYYRRFILLRRFYGWLSRRSGTPDPFLDLEPPGKPRQEADWLTPAEFARLLAAASSPRRRRRGLAERDRLVLLTLVATGLRRSELIALNWGDVDLEVTHPTLLVRCGKGRKPRRQPIARTLARELVEVKARISPASDAPVFIGLAGGRLQPTILAGVIRRAAERAGIEKHATAHTLRHTAATWLRQATGDARLVAEYLGHADLSTVSRYAHVATAELHEAAMAIADHAGLPLASE
jgi:integrase/recombinase XerC